MLSQSVRVVRCLLLVSLFALLGRPVLAAPAAEEAAANAKSAEIMLNAGDPEQALIHFRLAYEAVKDPSYLFNMAQCEFQLGRLKEALAHYQQYLESSDGGRKSDAVEMARLRIKAISLRKSVLSVNSLPPATTVRIDGPEQVSGNAPSDFRVVSGKYRISVSKPNYISQTSEIELGIADSRSMFFNLAPIPGRLEIRTRPGNATLYVRGNRARNPYIQDVEPGTYELYAEATDYQPKREVISISAGQKLKHYFPLDYVQRSGRPELIGFWTAVGALAGSTGMLASFESPKVNTTASGTVVAAGGVVGGIAGALVSRAYVADYVPDNVALFRIGAMSIGAVEGAMIGVTAVRRYSLRAAWTGGILGLGVGTLSSAWLDRVAPNYGRVTLIESSALIGALGGALAVTAFQPEKPPQKYRQRLEPIGVLAGLNVGLGVGLALAYLPDQRKYGPTWKRVALVDLYTAAGAFAGAVASTLAKCLDPDYKLPDCRFASNVPTARFTLAGGALGLAAGWFFTRNLDRDDAARAERTARLPLPVPTTMAVQGRNGPTLIPGLAAQGRF